MSADLNPILLAGQLAGMVAQIDWRALEAALENTDADFCYAREVEALIRFAREVQGDYEPGWSAEIRENGEVKYATHGHKTREAIFADLDQYRDGVIIV